jgi:hypothetical protein
LCDVVRDSRNHDSCQPRHTLDPNQPRVHRQSNPARNEHDVRRFAFIYYNQRCIPKAEIRNIQPNIFMAPLEEG